MNKTDELYLLRLHLAPPVKFETFEFHQNLWPPKTTSPDSSAIGLTQYKHVSATDAVAVSASRCRTIKTNN